MKQEQDAFEALKRELAIEPSPAFAAKVRASIADERPVRAGWMRPLLLAGAAAVVVIAWIATMKPDVERPVFRSAGPAEGRAEARADARAERPVSSAAGPHVVAKMERPVFRPAVTPAPEVLVDPADAEAVSRLLAFVKANLAPVPPSEPDSRSSVFDVVELAPMPPIEVRTIAVAQLYEEPPAAQGDHQ